MTPVRRTARALSLDRATAAGVASRMLSLLAGPVTLVLIARHFTANVQGYYYTFASLVAMQSFFELGLYIVVINVASHEWATLGLDESGRVVGNDEAAGRLAMFLRLLSKWYAMAAVLFLLVAGAFGWRFLSADPAKAAGIAWQAPWLVMVTLSAGSLWTLPIKSLLEGCGQVTTVSAFRAIGVLVNAAATWSTVLLGGGLWTIVAATAAGLLMDVLLMARYRALFRSLLAKPPMVFAWRTEVWPLQWRLGVQGVLSYFAFSLFTPVMFRYHGSVVAGQMGMTMQLAMALQSLGSAWLSARTPIFGVLIARQEYDALDITWRRVSVMAVMVTAGGGVAVVIGVLVLTAIGSPFSARLLPVLPTALLMLGATAAQGVQTMAVYLRAHKRDPLAIWGIGVSSVSGLLIYGLGRLYGPVGAASAYSGVMCLLNLPLVFTIWLTSRRRWHTARPGLVEHPT